MIKMEKWYRLSNQKHHHSLFNDFSINASNGFFCLQKFQKLQCDCEKTRFFCTELENISEFPFINRWLRNRIEINQLKVICTNYCNRWRCVAIFSCLMLLYVLSKKKNRKQNDMIMNLLKNKALNETLTLNSILKKFKTKKRLTIIYSFVLYIFVNI